MVHLPHLLTTTIILAVSGLLPVTQARRQWTHSTAAVCPAGVRPRDTLPGRWETINGTVVYYPPTAASWGPDRLDVFGTNKAGNLMHRSGNGCTWSAEWQNMGGLVTSKASVVSRAVGSYDIFARNAQGGVSWIQLLSPSSSSSSGLETTSTPWLNLGGFFQAAPAAVALSSARMHLFANGFDGYLYQRTWEGGTWQPRWISLGGTRAQGAPVPVNRGPGLIDLFYVTRSSSLALKSWDGISWSQTSFPGGSTYVSSEPSVVVLGIDNVHVFVLGEDYLVRHLVWDGSTWSAWQSLGGEMSPLKPVAISDRAGTIDLYIVDTEGIVRHRQLTATGWAEWEVIDGPTFVNELAITSWGQNNIDIFAVDSKLAVWHNW